LRPKALNNRQSEIENRKFLVSDMALTENAAAALGLTAIAGLSTLNPSSFNPS
jgi:hypothetical protein